MTGNALNNLGNVAREQRDFGDAQLRYDESLAIYRVLGDKWALAYLFEDVGRLACLLGQARRALRLVEAATKLRDEIGSPLTPTEAHNLEEALKPAQQVLDSPAQTTARAEGRAMSLEEAIQEALSG
jgi:hypothetical protein